VTGRAAKRPSGVRVAVDAMGGDHAPEEIVAGAVQAAATLDAEILLVGPAERLTTLLARQRAGGLPVRIIDAPDVIGMEEPPAMAVRRKRRSSIVVTLRQLREGTATAAVSAGNTGAAMGAALLALGRIPAVDRPAIAAVLPTLQKTPVVLLDVGANVDSRPKHLLQFGVMGHVYAHRVLGIPGPRIALLSNGEEASKGNDVTARAAELLRRSGLPFVGNVEGREVFSGQADVIVCDGFVGNIVLKFAEGLALGIRHLVREELAGPGGRLLALYLAPLWRRGLRFWRRLDYREYGGAPLLGVNGIVIIAHGRSTAVAIRNAIYRAVDAASRRIVEPITAEMTRIERDLRPLPASLERSTAGVDGGVEA